MRTRSLLRAAAVTATAVLATSLAAPAALAADVDPEAPVVVDDTVTLWPGESKLVDVLANDSDPAGDDLAVCRLPGLDLSGGKLPNVWVLDGGSFGGTPGELEVSSMTRRPGTYEIDYYTCSHTRLTPAKLTVIVQRPEPVDVRTTDRPGQIKVTNHNTAPVQMLVEPKRGCSVDWLGKVAAGATRTFRVHERSIAWGAFIGQGGLADHGRLRDIELTPRDAAKAKHGKGDEVGPDGSMDCGGLTGAGGSWVIGMDQATSS